MTRSFLAALALLGSAGLALAQAPAQTAAPAAARSDRMAARVCDRPVRPPSARYADLLTEKLALNDQQKDLLKAWQDARQKSRQDARAAMCAPKPDLASFAGRLDWRTKRMEAELAALKAERPALEAFHKSLDDKQKASWDEAREQRFKRQR